MSRRRGSEDDGVYEPVSLGIGWSSTSWLCFLLALPIRWVLRLLPWRPEYPWMWPLWMVGGLAALSVLGLLTGAVGWGWKKQASAKWAFIANAVVFGLVVLAVFALYWIRYLR